MTHASGRMCGETCMSFQRALVSVGHLAGILRSECCEGGSMQRTNRHTNADAHPPTTDIFTSMKQPE
eukprot:3735274-Rhodomonas_salina.5